MFIEITYVAFVFGRFGDYEIRRTDSKNPPKLPISETLSSESKNGKTMDYPQIATNQFVEICVGL